MSFSFLNCACLHKKNLLIQAHFHILSFNIFFFFRLRSETAKLLLLVMPKSTMKNPQQTSWPNIWCVLLSPLLTTFILFLSHVLVAISNRTSYLMWFGFGHAMCTSWRIANSAEAFYHGTSIVESKRHSSATRLKQVLSSAFLGCSSRFSGSFSRVEP